MNLNLILTYTPWVVLAICFVGMVVIVLRKMQLLLKLPEKPQEANISSPLLEKFKIKIRGVKYSSFQPAVSGWLEKLLRKLRLSILKIDNFFVFLIERLREKSQVWTVRSRAWMEQHRLKKIQKLQVLEKLDQAQILESIQKAKEEVKVEENNGKNKALPESKNNGFEAPEEKACIDLIARDPRNIKAYRKLGFLYLNQGNKEDAIGCFKQVLKLNPEDLEVAEKIKELD
ncbi:MAG: tetratricopeptide repeat protein [Candidatus Portnoybacteria bacterium]|nr:tetratricopeptide repeat protein [Candidatus Portnoybacteria bacterium]